MKSINKEPIKIENDSVIYMGVCYNKKQWEIKLKEINLIKYKEMTT